MAVQPDVHAAIHQPLEGDCIRPAIWVEGIGEGSEHFPETAN
jgi:hypothetical protein